MDISCGCAQPLDGRILGWFKPNQPGTSGTRRYASRFPRHTMKTKQTLELADVKAMMAAAEAEALTNKWAVAIAIVDDGGHLLALQRLDGAAAISSQIAPAKAQTAALGR